MYLIMYFVPGFLDVLVTAVFLQCISHLIWKIILNLKIQELMFTDNLAR